MGDELHDRRSEKRDDALKGVIGSVFGGDLEDFSHYNEEYEKYADVEVGKRGKKVKVSFGGEGATCESYREEATCPDCGKLVISTGVRFVPSPDDPHYDQLVAINEYDHNMHHHWYPFPDLEGCPARKRRIAVFQGLAHNKAWRRFWAFGTRYAWQNLDYNSPIEGRIYKAILWKDKLSWKIVYGLYDFVGWFEQKAWKRGQGKALPR